MKKKLCFVVQRYGVEINGGAEAYTRIYAEKLAKIYDVTAVSTCALDYQEWNNHWSGIARFYVDETTMQPMNRP